MIGSRQLTRASRCSTPARRRPISKASRQNSTLPRTSKTGPAMRCRGKTMPRKSCGDHTAMPQQRFNARLASAEGAERFCRGTAAADGEDLGAEALAGRRIDYAVLAALFLEQAV